MVFLVHLVCNESGLHTLAGVNVVSRSCSKSPSLCLGWEIYEEIYAAFWHMYEFFEPHGELLEEWFVLDPDFEPLEWQWSDVYRYPEPQTDRKYPPMILRDVTEGIAEYRHIQKRNEAIGKLSDMLKSDP